MWFRAFEGFAAEAGLRGVVASEVQGSDYESGTVRIDDEVWHIRTARNTPTKPGAFVAFWRRAADGSTEPFSESDGAAGLLVFVEQAGKRGVFRFTAEHLSALGVTSGERPGKRGFRVYPGWSTELNAQALSTQDAQASAFREY